MGPRHAWLVVLATIASIPLVAVNAQAQAWPLPEGTGSVSIIYHHVFVRDHLFAGGEPRDIGHIRSHVVTADVEYGISDRVSVRALLPYVAAKYRGSQGHGSPSSPDFHFIDDGAYHSGFQDVRAEVRYNGREFPVAITPFVAVGVPTHDYEFFAHSAIGLKMAELQIGSYLGGFVGRRVSVQGRVSYGIYERVAGHRRNRVNVDAEFTWTAGQRVQLFVFEAAQISHGGVELVYEELPIYRQQYWWPHHDRLGQAHFLNIGAGLALNVTPSLAVQASIARTVQGSNTHAASYGIAVGSTWGFSASARHRQHPAAPAQ